MKKTKILSVGLAAVFSLSMINKPISAEEPSSEYGTVINIMTNLELADNLDVKNPDAEVDRASFAASVLDLIAAESADGDSNFVDIEESEYKAEIEEAVKRGIISDEESRFRPNDIITYSEAATMLVNALGYAPYAQMGGGSENGYMNVARELGLNKDIAAAAQKRITVGEAAQLLYNAGTANVNELGFSGGNAAFEITESVFWKYHKIGWGYGVLNANEHTSLMSAVGSGKNSVRIDDFIGYIYYSSEPVDYLGYMVDYYYKQNDLGENVVLYITPREKRNDVISVNAYDILGYEDQVLTYEDGERTKKTDIPFGTSVIYNGILTIDYVDEQGKSVFTPDDGQVKMIDNNNDGVVDVVSILSYVNFVVSAVNEEDRVIYNKYDKTSIIDFKTVEGESDTAWIITDETGHILSFEDIQEWDVLSLAISRDGSFLRAVRSRKSVSGTVDKKYSEDNRNVISVNSEEYFVTDNYNNTIALGGSGIFYLDYQGNIAAVKADTGVNSYGFLIKVYEDEIEEEIYIKLLDQTGAVEKKKMAKKGEVDGNKYKNYQKASAAFANVSRFGVVVYRTNADDEVCYLDTKEANAVEESDSLRSLNELSLLAYNNESRSFTDKLIPASNTLLLKTPTIEFADDDSLYGVMSISDLVHGSKYTVQGFSTNPESILPECIHVQSNASGGLSMISPFMLITSISQCLNDDDEPTLQIEGFDQKGPVTLNVVSSYDEDYQNLIASDKEYIAELKDIKPGDFIKYSKNDRDEITSISILYSRGTDELGPFRTKFSTWFGNTYYPQLGRLMTCEEDVIGVTTTSSITSKTPDFVYRIRTDTKVYKVEDGRGSGVYVEDITNDRSAIEDYAHNGKNNRVFVYMQYVQAKMIVIYEE